MAEIVLHGVSKTYDNGVRALADLNLSIRSGEHLVLVGASGCGKTTTLRLIAGLEQPSSGTIHMAGRPMNDVPPWQRDVAMVFQKPALLPHRSVRANLDWGHCLRQPFWSGLLERFSPDRKRNEALETTARLLGLEGVVERKAEELSGGEVQRVALGRALLRRSAVRLLDEPLGHLDLPLRRQLRHQLHLLRGQFPATMVYVTHDPEEALALGERIAVLHEGVLLQVDTPHEVLNQPRHRCVAALFHTNPGPMNFIAGQVIRRETGFVFQAEEGPWPLPAGRDALWQKNLGRAAFLGVRPDDVYIQWHGSPSSEGMTVSVVEPCDQGCLIACSGKSLSVTAWHEQPLQAGSRVKVGFRLERAFLFDRVTGSNLEAADRIL